VVANEGTKEKCSALGLSAGPHAVRVLSFQNTPSGCINATYRWPCPSPPPTPPAAAFALSGACTHAHRIATLC
jgi:hypothetical protein